MPLVNGNILLDRIREKRVWRVPSTPLTWKPLFRFWTRLSVQDCLTLFR